MINIILTRHAVEEARTHGGLTPGQARDEVRAALEAGRRAKTKPRWATHDPPGVGRAKMRQKGREHSGGLRRGGNGTMRYFWNEEETLVYVAARDIGAWVIVTVMERVA